MLHICATAQEPRGKGKHRKAVHRFDYRVAAHFNDMKHDAASLQCCAIEHVTYH